MYFITYGARYLFDPRVGLTLPSVRLETEVNTAGVLEFSIAQTHELYDVIKEHDTHNPIVVYDNDVVKFRGTITAINQDFYLTKSVVCRGELAYLNDTLVRPYSTVEGEVSRTAPSTVDGYFRFLIAEHNSQADDEKRFSIVQNQGADLDVNNYLYRSDTQYPTVGETIKEKLLNTIGGYLQLDYSKQTPHLSYLADFTKANAQIIDFGINLLDYTSQDDASGVATYIIPVGKAIEKEKDDSDIDVQNERLTIKGEPDKTLETGYIKSGDIIYSARAVEKFGWIGACVEYDDVTVAANLVSKGLKTLKTMEMPAVTIEISAIDLAIIKPEHEPIATEQYVRVRSSVHDFDSYLLCTKLSYDLNNPENNVITLGTTQDSLTNKHIRSLNAMVNTVYEAADRISAEAKAAAVIAGLAQDGVQEVQTVSKEAAAAAIDAQEKADAAIDTSNAAAASAAASAEDAAKAIEAAREAEKEAQEAQAKADSATQAAQQLQQDVAGADASAKAAASAAALAQEQAAQASELAASATNAAQAVQEEVATANESIAQTKASVAAADAEIADVKSRLETTTTTMEATAESVQDLASEQETMKSSLSQNAAQISSTVESLSLLQGDFEAAQTDIQAAQTQAEAAAAGASEAMAAATQAQSAADGAAQAATDAEANAIAAATVYADSIQETLQGQIDGTIETWTGSVAPTESNPPANTWTDTDAKKKHIGDLYYDTVTGYAYRYDVSYVWILIKDTDVTKAIGDAAQAIADAANAAEAAAGAADAATTAQNAADDAKQAADAAQQEATALASRMTTAETSISQNSTDISLRATKKELEALTIGGSNLVRGTADWTIPNASVVYPMDYTVNGEVLRADVKPFTYSFMPPTLERGTQYTFCVDALAIGASSEVTLKGFNNLGTIYFSTTQSVGNIDWVRISVTFYGYQSYYGNNFEIEYKEGASAIAGDPYGIQLRHVQLVKGNKAPDWSPAYEDLVAYTDAQVKVNSNAIKAEVTKRTQTDSKVSTLTETADGLRIDLTATQGDVETLNSYLEYTDGTLTLGKNGDPSKVQIDNDSMDIVVGNTSVAEFKGDSVKVGNNTPRSSMSIANNRLGMSTADSSRYIGEGLFSNGANRHAYLSGNQVSFKESYFTAAAIASDGGPLYDNLPAMESPYIEVGDKQEGSIFFHADDFYFNDGGLPIASGGTGALTAAAARSNLGAVSSSNPTVTGTVTIGTYALTADTSWLYGSGAAFTSICTQKSNSYPVYGARVLYENASGTTGTATLSETAANFVYIEIFYAKVEGTHWAINSTKVFKPNGKRASLVAGQMAADNATIQLLIRTYNISGTSISAHTVSKYYNLAGATGTDSTAMRILAVIGYR